MLAHVLVGKFCDHLPLYRQSAIYARSGLDLDRALLAEWVGHCHQLLSPLVEAIRRYVLGGSKVHADDTPLPMLAPGKGRTKTARLWTYVRDDRPAGSNDPPAVWFAYSEDRKGQHPREHLKSFRGIWDWQSKVAVNARISFLDKLQRYRSIRQMLRKPTGRTGGLFYLCALGQEFGLS